MIRSYWKGCESEPKLSRYHRNSFPVNPMKWKPQQKFCGSGFDLTWTSSQPMKPLCPGPLWLNPEPSSNSQRLMESAHPQPQTFTPQKFPTHTQFANLGRRHSDESRINNCSSEPHEAPVPLPVSNSRVSQQQFLDSVINQPMLCSKQKFQPSEKFTASKPGEDFESLKMPNVLTALVNHFVEDVSKDRKATGLTPQPANSSDTWSDESQMMGVGELAIKLADLVLMDDAAVQSSLQQQNKMPNTHPQSDVTSNTGKCTSNIICSRDQIREEEVAATRHSVNESDSTLVPSSEKTRTFKKYLSHGLTNFKMNIITNYVSWKGPKTKVCQSYLKTQSSNFKQDQGQTRNGSNKYFLTNQKMKPVKERAGMSGWHCSSLSDSKSDSSSSSSENFSGRYFSIPIPQDRRKCKVFPKPLDYGESSALAPLHPRRSRKTLSCSSSGSSGRGSYTECVFCKTNGETSAVYRNHVLKDEQGRTVCEVLQRYVCPLCGATGFSAHTVKYCPFNKNPPAVATMTTLKSMRSSTGRKRYGPCSGQIRQSSFGAYCHSLPA